MLLVEIIERADGVSIGREIRRVLEEYTPGTVRVVAALATARTALNDTDTVTTEVTLILETYEVQDGN